MISGTRAGFLGGVALTLFSTGWALASLDQAELDIPPQVGVVTPPHPHEIEREFVSRPIHVDQLYGSMVGPTANQRFTPLDGDEPELIWLTGFAVDVVEEDRTTPASIEFLCHANLALGKATRTDVERRLFTLTQGQTDVRFPPGFGIPLLSNDLIRLNSQVLNLNQPVIDRTVRHRLRVRFVPDRDLGELPLQPLAQRVANVFVTLEDAPVVFNVEQPADHLAGAGCLPGEAAPGSTPRMVDASGRRFSGHWVVTPGRHEYRTLVTNRIAPPYDTTIHFIGIHVHPYSESLALVDLTTDKVVWKSNHKSFTEKVGVAWVDYFSSEVGLPFFAGHDYELISVYDNPTDRDSDAMAQMMLYFRDKEFTPASLRAGTAPLGG